MLTLGSVTVTLLAAIFALVAVFLMLIILVQKPKGGGLSGAFGGGGGSAQAAFGARTGDVLTWITSITFVVFILLAMVLTWAINPGTAGDASIEAAAEQATTSDVRTVDELTDEQTAEQAGEAAAVEDVPDIEGEAGTGEAPELQDPAGAAEQAAPTETE
ncbi:MAG: preprotein translocase subunit SecG [Phycisphaeraceae bacterium]